MKKKNLNSLQLSKATVSNLHKNEISGGLRRTDYRVCNDTYNSRERCKTNEVDFQTRPIC
ncbi:hypothetical protein IMCC3317_09030 [Kordia antarctica]|uniref:Uncharacterized protein n=1 Tax=Kordia antarctica TaxID=1218801 RepID=A0A7L4ZGI9_9FLAO|nr:class I lanthipeptide [Kordia antarctica]QHI35557.1 hypothetical protein IMCC3317_09030 [Kordia antarctica]